MNSTAGRVITVCDSDRLSALFDGINQKEGKNPGRNYFGDRDEWWSRPFFKTKSASYAFDMVHGHKKCTVFALANNIIDSNKIQATHKELSVNPRSIFIRMSRLIDLFVPHHMIVVEWSEWSQCDGSREAIKRKSE